MTPRKAETFDEICALERDNTDVGDYAILVDEFHVYLNEQAVGESPRASIEIPRAVFNAFVDWYERGVVPKADKRRTKRTAKQTRKFPA